MSKTSFFLFWFLLQLSLVTLLTGPSPTGRTLHVLQVPVCHCDDYNGFEVSRRIFVNRDLTFTSIQLLPHAQTLWLHS